MVNNSIFQSDLTLRPNNMADLTMKQAQVIGIWVKTHDKQSLSDSDTLEWFIKQQLPSYLSVK